MTKTSPEATVFSTSQPASEFVLVPREATRAMTMAGCDNLPSCEHIFGHAGEILRNAYRKMVEVAALSASQPNRMGTTPEMQRLYDKFGCRGEFSEQELSVIDDLAELHQISQMQTIRQALRFYQLHEKRVRDGETFTWSGDKARAKEFAALAATPAVGGEVLKFAQAVLHGDDEHRKWLLDAALAFVAGEPLPLPRAAPPASPLRGREILLALEKRHAEALSDLGEAPIGKLSIDAISRNWLGGRVNGLAIALEIARAALVASPPEQPAAETRQQKNEREMAEGSRCDGSCNDDMPCHCQPAAPVTGCETIPVPVWAVEDLLKYLRRMKSGQTSIYPLGLENLLQAMLDAIQNRNVSG